MDSVTATKGKLLLVDLAQLDGQMGIQARPVPLGSSPPYRRRAVKVEWARDGGCGRRRRWGVCERSPGSGDPTSGALTAGDGLACGGCRRAGRLDCRTRRAASSGPRSTRPRP